MIKHISIIGCGWLGLPLAKQFMKDAHNVKGSTTSVEKLAGLKSFGIDAFYVELTEKGVKGDIEPCLSGSEILVLNIPPGLRKHPETDFVKEMQFLIPFIENSSISKVIFISSTSVYGDDESIPLITENSVPNPDSETGKQLLEVEHLFQSNQNFQTTILRFSGLFGMDRHPAKHLSGKTNLKYPDAPVNLIHLEDCIGITSAIIKQDVWNDVFNASTTSHPSRQEYYKSICKTMDLAPPMFELASQNKGKYIDSTKLKQALEYKFKVEIE